MPTHLITTFFWGAGMQVGTTLSGTTFRPFVHYAIFRTTPVQNDGLKMLMKFIPDSPRLLNYFGAPGMWVGATPSRTTFCPFVH
jgi:hypothetical protein